VKIKTLFKHQDLETTTLVKANSKTRLTLRLEPAVEGISLLLTRLVQVLIILKVQFLEDQLQKSALLKDLLFPTLSKLQVQVLTI
jgi:hypothetical protein